MQRKQLTFERLEMHDSRIVPPIVDSPDYAWFRGELAELYLGRRELLFAMNFYFSEHNQKAAKSSRAGDVAGWAVFQLGVRGATFYGRVTESEGGFRHKSASGFPPDQFHNIGEARAYPGHRRRHSAHFLLVHEGTNYPQDELSVNVYLKPGFFGGWKEIIVREPEGHYCVAKP